MEVSNLFKSFLEYFANTKKDIREVFPVVTEENRKGPDQIPTRIEWEKRIEVS